MERHGMAPPLASALDITSERFLANRADMLEQLAVIDDLLDQAESGGGEAYFFSNGVIPEFSIGNPAWSYVFAGFAYHSLWVNRYF